MGKQFIVIIYFLIPTVMFSVTEYELIRKNGDTIIGYIVEDKPSISIVMENIDGELFVVPYKDILVVRPVSKGKNIEDKKDIIPQEDLENIELIPKISLKGYGVNELSKILNELTYRDLFLVELEQIEDTTYDVKNDIYITNRKSDTVKYTLLNIVPGLGSFLQGDYASGFYTLSSVLGAIVYNSLSSVPGEDLYFIINLNAAVAYASSFFAPYRYNINYNQALKDKLQL